MKKLCYYISGHGLGHASRSCHIINTLRQRHPQLAVEVVSDAHDWFFKGFLDSSVPVRRRTMDLGVLQRDSLVMQEEQTLQRYREFLRCRETLVCEEAKDLRQGGVSLVAADIPATAFAAAAMAGIPGVGISNFTWDWIYQGLAEKFPDYQDVLEALEADYGKASRLLRLPFHGDIPAIDTLEDLPLVARRGTREPREVRMAIDIPEGCRFGLVSFGGFGLQGYDFRPLARLKNWVFVTEGEKNWKADNLRSLPAGMFPYPDLVRAADAVITKPGYGIVSEAIANDTAVLYTSRGDFREQALLVAGMRRYARCRFIDNQALRAGLWGEALEELMRQPWPAETLRSDGHLVAADRLAQLVDEA
ncbi:arabinose kinase [Desulfuromonas versatilis]|uniref:Arabinose kinase n=1 Tax=Desulfuromonas versatilis TaxID=2802975 RepID=A0ABM8HPM5_9BACT|nr:hypothetical protein [Desulfuromonas versatilis]BCR03587.1 arabinose kinase [Desulfuromonas versatilis]